MHIVIIITPAALYFLLVAVASRPCFFLLWALVLKGAIVTIAASARLEEGHAMLRCRLELVGHTGGQRIEAVGYLHGIISRGGRIHGSGGANRTRQHC